MKIFFVWPFDEPISGESLEFYTGFKNNDVIFVNTCTEADYIVCMMDIRNCLMMPHYRNAKMNMNVINEMNSNTNHSKEIIIDYNDWQDLRNVPDNILPFVGKYFKRSIINKKTMSIVDYPREIIPISYGIRSDFLNYDRPFPIEHDICCMFPATQRRGCWREIIPHIVNEYNGSKFVGNIQMKGDRYNNVNTEYFRILKSSKIIVTANPPNWEGDFRLWEALMMGNLVLCDKMIMNIRHLLIDGEHIKYYNSEKELRNLINYYAMNNSEAEEIGLQGRNFVLQHHKFTDRVNEILNMLRL